LKLSAQSHPILWSYLPQFEQTLAEAQLTTQSILVGLSGGVDSSVSALCLLALKYNVAALFMKNWDEDDGTEFCTAKADLADAQAVADLLGFKLHTANFAAEYWDQVFAHFLQSYAMGHTPNPDVLCNREIKFQVFRDYATALGFSAIATGHYAQIKSRQDSTGQQQPLLCQSVDTNKDQTYFLNGVAQQDFQNVVFPLAALNKSEVRAIAKEAGLITSTKKDSTGICFIGERRFTDFLSQYIAHQPGSIVDEHGNKLGEHHGLSYYTLGQRKGIGIGGTQKGLEKPWFVAEKNLQTNELLIVQDPEHPLLLSHWVVIDNMNWITTLPEILDAALLEHNTWHGLGRCRHRQPLVDLSINFSQQDISDSDKKSGDTQPVLTAENTFDATTITLQFHKPQWAVTPGQYLVLYHNEICLGGGTVKERWL